MPASRQGTGCHTYHLGCLQAELIESRSWDQISKWLVVGAMAWERDGKTCPIAWSQKVVHGWHQSGKKGELEGWLRATEEPHSVHRLPDPALSMPPPLRLFMLSRNFSSFR